MTPPAAPAGSGALTCRANPLIELHWRDWGDDSVVLEACSGQLFQFDALSAALMACFEEGPQAFDSVLAALSSDLGVAAAVADDEFRDTVRAVVAEFQKLGWLEPIIAA